MQKQSKVLTIMCLLTLASCGGGSSDGGNPSASAVPNMEQQNIEGSYKAILRPYNNTLSGWVPNGMTDIKITGDEIDVKTWLDDSANVVHMQNIHMGTVCPTIEADINRDGFVDFNESLKVSKNVLIPLDGDLNSQDQGAGIFPKGNFTYAKKASLSNLLNDLKDEDMNTQDYIDKLSEGFSLEGKVVIVTGVATDRSLPVTMSTLNEQPAQASTPIACGIIKKM